jgi:hypothetical protein
MTMPSEDLSEHIAQASLVSRFVGYDEWVY